MSRHDNIRERELETLKFVIQKHEASSVAQRLVQMSLLIDMEESNSNWLAEAAGQPEKLTRLSS